MQLRFLNKAILRKHFEPIGPVALTGTTHCTQSLRNPTKTFLSVFFLIASMSVSDVANAIDLADLATVVERSSHKASSHDRSGGNDDNVTGLAPGETHVMLDTNGPGLIGHIWLTVSGYKGHQSPLRDLVIRIYWEGSKVPSVEAPLGDFFGLGHGREYQVTSAPVNVGADTRAMNCYWPMPFYQHARVEIYNNGRRGIRRIYYNLDYELGAIRPNQALFHAQFRSTKDLPSRPFSKDGKDNFVILETRGEGHYVGCFLFVDSAPGGWWGEGDEMIFLDGEELPSIIGTGTEDYFCNAWGFDETFSYPFYGAPLLDKLPDGWKQTTAYRFHIPSPVRFKKSVRVTIEHHWSGTVANDYSCVAYWYQRKCMTGRPALPAADDNHPRKHLEKPEKAGKPATRKYCGTEFETALREQGVSVRAMTLSHQQGYSGGALSIDPKGRVVPIEVPVPAPGTYRVVFRFYDVHQDARITVGARGGETRVVPRVGAKGAVVDLGTVTVGDNRTISVTANSEKPFAVDYVLAKVHE